jgi:type I restriction enzyme S subunit
VIADLKPYPEYKESALPWLGRVPRHWDVRQARQIGRLLKGGGGTKEDAVDVGVPCVRYGDLYTTHTYFIRASRAFIGTTRAVEYTPIQYGDVLFAASGETIDEIGKSAVNLIRAPAYCGGDVIVLRPSIPVHAPFLGYALDSRPAAHQKSTMGRGTTVKHIYPGELKALHFPLPPLEEQAAITRFLDWAQGRLGRAILAKRKVIALLNEQKHTIIHCAVTGRLDPSVPLKRSGVPWLGDIPEHWDVVRNSALFSPRVEPGIQGWPVLQVSLHSGITVEQLDQFGRPKRFIADETKYKLVRAGDLAYNTMRMWQGAVGVSATDGLVSPAYVVIKPRPGIEPRFYEYVFRTRVYMQQVNRHSTGIVSDRNRLYWESFKQMPNVRPPLEEQQAICRSIREDASGSDTAISRLEREIYLLREYRARLVADLVTGKVDVRSAAEGLSAEHVALEAADVDEALTQLDEEEDGVEVTAEEAEA